MEFSPTMLAESLREVNLTQLEDGMEIQGQALAIGIVLSNLVSARLLTQDVRNKLVYEQMEDGHSKVTIAGFDFPALRRYVQTQQNSNTFN